MHRSIKKRAAKANRAGAGAEGAEGSAAMVEGGRRNSLNGFAKAALKRRSARCVGIVSFAFSLCLLLKLWGKWWPLNRGVSWTAALFPSIVIICL